MKSTLLRKPPAQSRSAATKEAASVKAGVSAATMQSPIQFTLKDAQRYIRRTSEEYDYPWKKTPDETKILNHIAERGVNWKQIQKEYIKEEKKKKRKKQEDVSSENSAKSPKKKQKTTESIEDEVDIDMIGEQPKKKKKRQVVEETKTQTPKKKKKKKPRETITPDLDLVTSKTEDKKTLKRKIEKDESDSSEKAKRPPKKKYKPKEKKEETDDIDTGSLPSVEEALQALEAKKLPDDIESWDLVQKGIEAGAEKDDFGALLKRLVTIFYGYTSKANQYKFPTATSEKKTSSEFGEGLREIKKPRKYTSKDDQIIQQLRWISTVLYNYIKSLKEPLEEVQALWDGEFLHITENSLTNNTRIMSLLNNKDDFLDFLVKYEGKEKSKDRFERHPAALGKALKEKDKTGPINALSQHLNDNKKSKLNVPGSDTVSERTPRKMHAEIRLGINYLNKNAPKKQKEGATKIWVAGVKRPCFACFVRLTVLKGLFSEEEIELVHNPHKGLLWPSGPAWTGATKEDKLAALDELGLSSYIEGLKGGTKEPMQKHVKRRKSSLTFGVKSKTGLYDRDTDSE